MYQYLPVASVDNCESVVHCGLCLITKVLESAGQAFYDIYERQECSSEAVASKESGVGMEPKVHDCDANAEVPNEDQKWTAKHKKKKLNSKPSGNVGSTSSLAKLKKLIEGPNLYSVLGVHETCGVESIKKAYRKLALQYHPDKKKSRDTLREAQGSKKRADVLSSQIQNDTSVVPSSFPSTCVGDSVSQHSSSSSSSGKQLSPTFLRNAGLENYTDKMMFLLIQDAYDVLSDPVSRKQYDSALPFDDSIPTASDVDSSNPQSFFDVFAPVFQLNARWSFKKPVPKLGTLSTKMSQVHQFYKFWWGFETTRDFSMHNEYDVTEAECREERRWMERENMKILRKYIKEDKQRISKLTDLVYSLDPRVQREKEEERQRKEQLKEAKRKAAECKLEQQRAEEQRRKAEQEAKEQEKLDQERHRNEERQRAKALLKQSRQNLRQLCSCAVAAKTLDADVLQDACLTLPVDRLILLNEKLQTIKEKKNAPKRIAEELIRFVKAFRLEREQQQLLSESQALTAGVSVSQQAVASKPSPNGQSSNDVWTAEELSLLAKGIQKYPGGTSKRWDFIAEMLGTKPLKAVLAKAKELADKTSSKPVGGAAKASTLFEQQTAKASCPTASPPQSGVSQVKVTTPIASDWTDIQQQALEAALVSHHGKLSLKEHWVAIANEVPGKTPKACLARFKEIRAAIQCTSSQAE